MWKSESDRAAGKRDTSCGWARCVEGKRVDEDLSYSPSVLSLVLVMFLFPCVFRRLQHTVDFFIAVFTSLCFALCFHFSPAVAKAVARYKNANGLSLVLSYALHLLCFRVVLASFTLTTR